MRGTSVKIALRIATIAMCVIVGAVIALWAASVIPGLNAFASSTESQDSQVVNAVNRTEEVSLLSLGIQGIHETRGNSKVFGIDVPGSEKVTFIQYTFNAKLGLDGEKVTVIPTGENAYTVSIPEFIFIGHDKIEFESAAEDGGLLSWVTTDVDPLDSVNEILDDDAQAQYLESNEDLLRDQAEAFYEGLLRSVSPDITVTFDYS